MKKFVFASMAAAAAIAAVSPAMAAQGCGAGWHRGPYGHCRPNGRGPIVLPAAPVVGYYYEGHGYWDGHNYYPRRERWHGGWRYRH